MKIGQRIREMRRMQWQSIHLKNSIQTRLGAVMALMLVIILAINMFIYQQFHGMVSRIDRVFVSNVTIGELTDTLDKVQDSVYAYLNTKGSEALENYYRYEQDYRSLIEKLNDVNTDDEVYQLEKNIRSMSFTYLEKSNETVQAKRGRNIERYKEAYGEEKQLYEYISYYIDRLNRGQFQVNSDRYRLLLSAMNIIELFCMIIMGVVFAFSLLAVTMLVRTMIQPLSQLSSAAHQVAEGNFDVEVPDMLREDEIGVVTKTFGQMLTSIREYIVRLRSSMEQEAAMKARELSMEANLKEAQLKFLQAQINPHFLYNSLNAGAQLAVMEDADATGKFLGKMAEFFRYNVRSGDGSSTLGQEITLVDTYIYILNVRFAGDITFEKEIEPGFEDVQVPGMILQPLVENAVSHGIRDCMDRGVIRLSVFRDGDIIEVTVADNGRGMTRDEIIRVLEKQEKDPEEQKEQNSSDRDGTGIGLGNVMERLELYYNRDDLFSIYSAGPDQGTEVTVLLPIGAGENEINGSQKCIES